MAKPSSSPSSSPTESCWNILSPAGTISEDLSPESVAIVLKALEMVGVSANLPDHCHVRDFLSVIIHDVLKPLVVQPGRVTCLLTVKRSIIIIYSRSHGGAIAAIDVAISIACARTVIGDDKDLFLGELCISYLSGAPQNAEVIVDASVTRRGRNVTVVAVDFKDKETHKLIYQSRSTFFNMPISKL